MNRLPVAIPDDTGGPFKVTPAVYLRGSAGSDDGRAARCHQFLVAPAFLQTPAKLLKKRRLLDGVTSVTSNPESYKK